MSGRIQVVTGADPVAGAEISHTVALQTWRLYGIAFRLVTSAVVGARQVHVLIDDGTSTVHRWIANDTQAASLTRDYLVDHYGFQPPLVGTFIHIAGAFPLGLAAGWRVRTVTDAFDPTAGTGDNFGAPLFHVEVL